MDIPCEIVKDLIVMYIDDVCSEKSREIVKEHMEGCTDCREYYESLKEPVEVKTISDKYVEIAKEPFLKIRKRNFLNAVSAIVVTAAVFIVCAFVVQEVGVVNDFFFPKKSAYLVIDDNSREWVRVSIEKQEYKDHIYTLNDSEYLSYDSVFFKKKITNSANSEGDIHLRIKNTEGDILIDSFTLKSGTTYECDLKLFEDYVIEASAGEGRYFINFS